MDGDSLLPLKAQNEIHVKPSVTFVWYDRVSTV